MKPSDLEKARVQVAKAVMIDCANQGLSPWQAADDAWAFADAFADRATGFDKPKATKTIEELEQAVIDALAARDEPIATHTLRKRLGVGMRRLRSVLVDLHTTGAVARGPNGRGWTLPKGES